MYIADGDYIKDIEVNDLKNRYTLTKGATQKMVNTPITFTDTPRLLLSVYTTVPSVLFHLCYLLWEYMSSLH